MRVNTAKSIETANIVLARFGSWKAARESARYEGGKFVVRSAANGGSNGAKVETTPTKP
ncbi:hypothetical protein [Allosphingosinicella deserti]|nr:hypothetical protein [Sphingomonas deserti]